MRKTPSQKTELKIGIVVGVIVLLILSFVYSCNKYSVVFVDKQTKTKYVDCGKFNKVVYSNGEVLAYGNEKTEYENNTIGE